MASDNRGDEDLGRDRVNYLLMLFPLFFFMYRDQHWMSLTISCIFSSFRSSLGVILKKKI